MNRPLTVTKVALVPLSKLEMLRKRTASTAFATSDIDSQQQSHIKQQKLVGDDPNLRKALKLDSAISEIVNDTKMEDDEKLQKYLSALRNYVLFRNKYRSSQQQPTLVKIVSHESEVGSIDKQQLSSPEKKLKPIVTPSKEILPQYAGDHSPTRSLIKINPSLSEDDDDTGEVDANDGSHHIISGLKGVHKRRGLDLINDLKNNPNIKWNKEGHVTINNQHFPGSNIKDLVNYEIIKYSKKGKEELLPKNYDTFFSFLKSESISPHKTSRPNRQISLVNIVPPQDVTGSTSSSTRELKFENDEVNQQSLIGKGFASHYWDSY